MLMWPRAFDASRRYNGLLGWLRDGVQLLAMSRIILKPAAIGLVQPGVGHRASWLSAARRDVPATTGVCPLAPITTRYFTLALTALHLPSLSLTISASRHLLAVSLTGSKNALGHGILLGKFTDAPVGRALLPSASLECDFGAWDVEAKLAALAQNTQHTLSASHNTPWCTTFPRPLHFPSCARCSWTSTPSTQLPLRRAPRVRLPLSPVTSPSPSIPSSVSDLSAFASIQRASPRQPRAHLPRLLVLVCCRPAHARRALLEAPPNSANTPKQCIKTSHTYAITPFRYIRAPGYLSSLEQHT